MSIIIGILNIVRIRRNKSVIEVKNKSPSSHTSNIEECTVFVYIVYHAPPRTTREAIIYK